MDHVRMEDANEWQGKLPTDASTQELHVRCEHIVHPSHSQRLEVYRPSFLNEFHQAVMSIPRS